MSGMCVGSTTEVIVKCFKPVYTALSGQTARDRFEEFAVELG